jgi:hypothetical protein
MWYIYIYTHIQISNEMEAQQKKKKKKKLVQQCVYIYIYIYIHSAKWCEDWVLWLGEGHSLVPYRSNCGYEPGGAWGNNTYI